MPSLPPSYTLLGALIVLAPLAVYCLVVARINLRATPSVVTGAQDCAALLLALSGFVVYLGPSVLTGFNYLPRDIWLYNHFSSLRFLPPEEGRRLWPIWWLAMCGAYLLLVVTGAIWLLLLRRRVTCIYNVDPPTLNAALDRALADLGLVPVRQLDQILLGAGRIRIVAWPTLRHVNLKWSGPAPQSAIEQRLAVHLAVGPRKTNPAGWWLMLLSAALFLLLFAIAVLYQVARFFEGRW